MSAIIESSSIFMIPKRAFNKPLEDFQAELQFANCQVHKITSEEADPIPLFGLTFTVYGTVRNPQEPLAKPSVIHKKYEVGFGGVTLLNLDPIRFWEFINSPRPSFSMELNRDEKGKYFCTFQKV